MRSTSALLGLTLLMGAGPAPAATARPPRSFTWQGQLDEGGVLRIRSLKGAIDVHRASGKETRVAGVLGGGVRGSQLRFVVVKHKNDVTICALWLRDEWCDRQGVHSPASGRVSAKHRAAAHFLVYIAPRVNLDVATIRGDIDVRGASADVTASGVNGDISVFTSAGRVQASTVNGNLHVRSDSAPGTDDLEYTTVKGSVTLDVPATFSGRLDVRSFDGRLRSDFPMTMESPVEPRHFHATIGDGKRRIRVSTIIGDIAIRKIN
jgi:hypothetical protein